MDGAAALECHRRMLRIRRFEEAIIAHHPVGHLSIGQEGAIVGACMALRDDDYVCLMDPAHPQAETEKLALDDYLRLDHIDITYEGLAPKQLDLFGGEL